MAKITDLSSLENAPKTLETNKIIRRFYKDLMAFAEQQNKATEADKLAAMMIADMFFIYKKKHNWLCSIQKQESRKSSFNKSVTKAK
ncbi:hypothetical protein [Vibrio parahaemolyticus]|uniref:hypothetical protein n=1 Tax=Vibrio parahaemolyticus TaxID=670 RepID=UPI0004274573|nr:hypothetical protein [Vibrio parahaemolyticus]